MHQPYDERFTVIAQCNPCRAVKDLASKRCNVAANWALREPRDGSVETRMIISP